jgi:hypothetical protein
MAVLVVTMFGVSPPTDPTVDIGIVSILQT